MITLILDSKKNSHYENLLLEIDSLKLNEIADTYHIFGDYNFDENYSIAYRLKLIFQKSLETIKKLELGQVCYFPFDFSDQYLGAIKIENLAEGSLGISYQCIEEYNCSFPPSYFLLNDIIPTIKDDIENTAIVNKEAFIKKLQICISSL